MFNSKYHRKLANIILTFMIIVIFITCVCEWIVDQPFYSVERFRAAEYRYRLNEVIQLSKKLIFQRQLCDNMQRSPEIFLQVLDRLFPDRDHAQDQFKLDELRNAYRLRYEEEYLSFAVSDLTWVTFIESQIVFPTWQAPTSLLFQTSATPQDDARTLSTQSDPVAQSNLSASDLWLEN